jgi:hypothetical protein
MSRTLTFAVISLAALASTAASRAQQYHTPPACWSAARMTHGPWSEQPGERVAIGRAREAAAADAKWTPSPNGAYRFRQIDPDFSGPPPWNTRFVIEAERPEAVVLELRNHGNGAAYANWMNEKLVLVRVWWGRVIGADIIVDAESGEIVWKESVRAGDVAFEQSRGRPCPPR